MLAGIGFRHDAVTVNVHDVAGNKCIPRDLFAIQPDHIFRHSHREYCADVLVDENIAAFSKRDIHCANGRIVFRLWIIIGIIQSEGMRRQLVNPVTVGFNVFRLPLFIQYHARHAGIIAGFRGGHHTVAVNFEYVACRQVRRCNRIAALVLDAVQRGNGEDRSGRTIDQHIITVVQWNINCADSLARAGSAARQQRCCEQKGQKRSAQRFYFSHFIQPPVVFVPMRRISGGKSCNL